MKKQILFLCTGNYYRSRFAEILFNHIAHKEKLGWSAFSRALMQEKTGNRGPISPFAFKGLAKLGIFHPQMLRFPVKATTSDFEQANLIIALKESEHKSYVFRHFKQWDTYIKYWQIDDIDVQPARLILPQLAQQVRKLSQELINGKTKSL